MDLKCVIKTKNHFFNGTLNTRKGNLGYKKMFALKNTPPERIKFVKLGAVVVSHISYFVDRLTSIASVEGVHSLASYPTWNGNSRRCTMLGIPNGKGTARSHPEYGSGNGICTSSPPP